MGMGFLIQTGNEQLGSGNVEGFFRLILVYGTVILIGLKTTFILSTHKQEAVCAKV